MKIINKIMENNCLFVDLRYGEVCIYEGCTYMKIEEILTWNAIKKNAINLNTLRLDKIPENAAVVEVNAELIITQKEN